MTFVQPNNALRYSRPVTIKERQLTLYLDAIRSVLRILTGSLICNFESYISDLSRTLLLQSSNSLLYFVCTQRRNQH